MCVKNGKKEIIIHTLRIGCTYLLRGVSMDTYYEGRLLPRCLACQVELTVEHVLLYYHLVFLISVEVQTTSLYVYYAAYIRCS